MANKDSSQALKCSFCGKSQKQVIKLIAGPGVYICDECIELCVEIIEEEKVEKLETSSEEYLPLPKEQSIIKRVHHWPRRCKEDLVCCSL